MVYTTYYICKSMKKYDFIMGLGRACACSQSMRLAGLQLLSQPWDWITYELQPQGPDLLLRVGVIGSGFKGWFEEEDIEFVKKNPASGKDLYKNRRNQIIYAHDFPPDVPMHESYPAIRAKYDRRVKRFQRLLAEAKSDILAVYMDAPTYPTADVETCREAQKRLQALYPNVKVDFLMFSLETGRKFEDRVVEDLGGGFTRVAFDFRDRRPGKPDHAVLLPACASIMREIASVRDYRTRAEIKEMNRRTRRVKMQEAGAKSEWEYFWMRRRRELENLRDILFPRLAIAKMRSRKYDHVLSLGMNCEPAYRFSLSWGFVDSTPFAWALSPVLKTFIRVLHDPEALGSDDFDWHAKSLMWKCRKTGMYFHGRLVFDPQGLPPTQDALDADKADLSQKLAYLREKFKRIMSDESSKALIFRVHTEEVLRDDINNSLDEIQRTLEANGARNYTLVVVVERAVRRRIAAAPNRVVRAVNAFNPGGYVTKAKFGDPVGWEALFTEFAPAKILPKKHPFKFERE